MGFCPSGGLSVPHVVSWASPIFQKNDFQMLLAVKIVALCHRPHLQLLGKRQCHLQIVEHAMTAHPADR